MARRNLLHKSLLNEFKTYLDQKGVQHRPGKGTYQVLQVRTCVSQGKNKEPAFVWSPIYEKDDSKEHYTVQEELINTVRLFINHRHTRPTTTHLIPTEPPHVDWTKGLDFSFSDKHTSVIPKGDTHKQMSIVFTDGENPNEHVVDLRPMYRDGEFVHKLESFAAVTGQVRDKAFEQLIVDSLSKMPEIKYDIDKK